MRRSLLAVLMALMTACSSVASPEGETSAGAPTSAPDDAPAPGSSETVPAEAAPTTTTQPAPTTTERPEATPAPGPPASPERPEPSPAHLTAFIATVEELVAGTAYEGAPIEEPELFLATGWLFCDWLDAGSGPDAALTRYLEELAGGVDAADDDQLVLAGALLGGAVGVLCPEHAASLGG